MSDEYKVKRQWCMVCGQPKGNCTHHLGFTSNANEGYRAWLAEQKRLMELGEPYTIKNL